MKKMIALFLVGVMMMLSAGSAVALAFDFMPPSHYTMKGDVTGDQVVNAKDALEVLKYSVDKTVIFLPANPTPEQQLEYEQYQYYKSFMKIMGDVNEDEEVNAKDALEILKYTVGKIDRFPIEESTPAVTPTDL